MMTEAKKQRIRQLWILCIGGSIIFATGLYFVEVLAGPFIGIPYFWGISLGALISSIEIGIMKTFQIIRQVEQERKPEPLVDMKKIEKYEPSAGMKKIEKTVLPVKCAPHNQVFAMSRQKKVETESLSDGMRAIYQGKQYPIASTFLDKIVLATADINSSEAGFVRNGEHGNFYKVVDKADVEEEFYAQNEFFYKGIKCCYRSWSCNQEGQICLGKYLDDEVTKEYLEQNGFVPVEEEGWARRPQYIYEKVVDLHDSELNIIRNRLEHSPFGSKREQEEIPSSHEEWIIYLAKQLKTSSSSQFTQVLLGSQGCGIPGALFSTDMDVVINEVIPSAYEFLVKENKADTHSLEIRKEIFWREISSALYTLESSGLFWYTDEKIMFCNEYKLYKIYMKLYYYDLYLQQKKEQVYPYIYAQTNKVEYWLNKEAKEWLKITEPIYWGEKMVHENFAQYVHQKLKKFNKDYGMHVYLEGDYGL